MKKCFRIAALIAAIGMSLAMFACSNSSDSGRGSGGNGGGSGGGGTTNGGGGTEISKQAGSISYATTSVEKLSTAAAFTNELTKTGDGTVTYASSSASVATVNESTGEVTIVAVGTTTITATVADSATYSYETKTASYTLTVAFDYKTIPLTLEAIADGTITLANTKTGFKYSKNGGEKTDCATPEQAITVSAGDTICLFANGTGSAGSTNNDFVIDCSTTECYVYGNVMSLEDADGYSTCTTIKSIYEFQNLFHPSPSANQIKSHPTKKLVLPATTLKVRCYENMFYNCPKLTVAPDLPATTLADQCYYEMFSFCAIETAPALPATTLASGCYKQMFRSCERLTKAPDLPAATLASNCYNGMFSGCTSLNYIKCLATNTSATDCYKCMLFNVKNKGTFVKAASATVAADTTDDPTKTWQRCTLTNNGKGGIPTGWDVQDAN